MLIKVRIKIGKGEEKALVGLLESHGYALEKIESDKTDAIIEAEAMPVRQMSESEVKALDYQNAPI